MEENYLSVLNYLLTDGIIVDGKCISITVKLDRHYQVILCGDKLKNNDKIHICSVYELNFIDGYHCIGKQMVDEELFNRIKVHIIKSAYINNYKIKKEFVDNYDNWEEESCEEYYL